GATQQQPVDLLSALSELWPSTPVLMLNDVAAAGYRYIRSAQEDFCIITVGSGIGNKVFLGGHPVTGPAGRGGEIGHIRVDHSPDALPCDCGGHGHLGGIASGRGALLVAQRLAMAEPQRFSRSMPAQQGCADPADLHNEALVQAFLAGDPWTEDLIRQVARPLGQMLASLHLAIGLERFVIFGGFALALGEGYRQELVQAAAASGWDVGQDWNRMVELGVPDGQSGMIGAGRYAALFAQHEADGGFDDARASHHVVSQSSADDLR
ncbi:MAG: ROK family protein, partial [Gemmatimonadetes bacterium]|nr:ROK family protein [Gemmatimonadota bacterium]